MKRLRVTASVAMFAVCAAGADTVKDGSVSVKPGKWLWKQETSIIGFGSKEQNLECLIPEEAHITLSKLANDLQKGCAVDNVREISGGYLFKLKCSGKYTGDADATLIHTDTMMKINAKGSVSLAFIPAGFSMKSDATYQGDCSQAEIDKARTRWMKKNPGKPPMGPVPATP